MTSSLGRELPPRRLVAWVALGATAFFLLALVGVVREAAAGQTSLWWIALVVALFVLLMAWGTWSLARRHVFVSDDAVTLCTGTRVTASLPFDQLTRVLSVVDGSQAAFTPEFWNKALILQGTTTAGRRAGRPTTIKVTAQYVESIDPLLRAVAPEVRRRPDLIPDERSRALFEEYLGQTRG